MSVHKNNSDDFLKKIANDYVERYGGELQREADELAQFPGMTISELRVNKSVRKRITAQKRKRYIPMIATLAACFVIAFIFIIPNLMGADVPFAPEPPAAPADEAPAAEPPPAPAPADPGPMDPAPAPEPPPAAEEPPWAEDAFEPEPPMYDIIPLAVPLPDGFTQVGFEQDYGKSIYLIQDDYLDDVVLTLERTELPSDLSDMTVIDINGLTVFGRQTETYSLLLFMHEGVLHTLTSEHDINTLLRLAGAFG
jgi:hypothetical protein